MGRSACAGIGPFLGLLLLGCPSDDPPADGGADSGGSGIASVGGSSSSASGMESTAAETGPATSTGEAASSSGEVATAGGDLYDCQIGDAQCNDGMDNDGDDKVDANDPECTGPCDDDESSFRTGISGDNSDCKQDCFFDGNSGQGNDGCLWDLRCDPANPGEFLGCEYDPDRCDEPMMGFSDECIEICGAFVPNGCDCFGCCTVQTGMGEVSIFLNSGPDCSLDNLDACQECTPQQDCGNTCEPEMCEVCFGEPAPPEGCDEPNCPPDQEPCLMAEDCPDGYFCLTGCCAPFEPTP